MNDHQNIKQTIRKKILSERNSLSEAEQRRGAVLLTERILGHQWFYRAEYFLCFVSYGSEISTWEILQEALKAKKKVYVPKVTADREAEMAFFRIASLDELTDGYRGIPEPPGNTEQYRYDPEEVQRTLMLMPGVAFDPFRNRLGYGKGFYDRYLCDKPQLQLRTIAVGHRCQMVEELPTFDTDIRPYQVICV